MSDKPAEQLGNQVKAQAESAASRVTEKLDRVLVTVTGKDRPGVTSTLTGILADKGAELIDIEQVVVQKQLTLCLLFDIAPSSDTLKEVLFAAKKLGMELDFVPMDAENGDGETQVEHLAAPSQQWVITAIGRRLDPAAIHAISSTLATVGANIESVSRLSETSLASVEIHVRLPEDCDHSGLKRKLLAVATEGGFDASLQRESLYRRSKRLVVMDMDSTLISIEVIDELSKHHGVSDKVVEITERAMNGKMDYDESLRQRVALLEGLDEQVLKDLCKSLPLNDGAEKLIRVLKRLGYRIAVLSGAFPMRPTPLRSDWAWTMPTPTTWKSWTAN